MCVYVRPVTNFKGKNVILLALMKGWIVFLCQKKKEKEKLGLSKLRYPQFLIGLQLLFSLPVYFFFFPISSHDNQWLTMLRPSGSCMRRCSVMPEPVKVDVGDLEARRQVTSPHSGAWSNRAVIFSAIFRPTPAASLANLNSFRILMRFLARWHQVC